MTLRRRGWLELSLAAVAVALVAGCNAGGPQRASDIQNVNAISDDIAAVTMTQNPSSRAHDPNLPTVIPRTYTTSTGSKTP
jgi:hypothetical protein